MKIEVAVRAGAKKEEVVPLEKARYKVSVKEKALQGKANETVREVLADFFKVPKSRVLFLAGHKSKKKYIEIVDAKD